jgi:hypothetical protein
MDRADLLGETFEPERFRGFAGFRPPGRRIRGHGARSAPAAGGPGEPKSACPFACKAPVGPWEDRPDGPCQGGLASEEAGLGAQREERALQDEAGGAQPPGQGARRGIDRPAGRGGPARRDPAAARDHEAQRVDPRQRVDPSARGGAGAQTGAERARALGRSRPPAARISPKPRLRLRRQPRGPGRHVDPPCRSRPGPCLSPRPAPRRGPASPGAGPRRRLPAAVAGGEDQFPPPKKLALRL